MFSLNGITTRDTKLLMESKPLSRKPPFYLYVLKFESSIPVSASKLTIFSILSIYNYLLRIKTPYNNGGS